MRTWHLVMAAAVVACVPEPHDPGDLPGLSLRTDSSVSLGLSTGLLPVSVWTLLSSVASCEDERCPSVSGDGSTVVVEGGCVDEQGLAWHGTATLARAPDGSRTATYDGWGYQDPDGGLVVHGEQHTGGTDGEGWVQTPWLEVTTWGGGPLDPPRALRDRGAVLVFREHELVVDEEGPWSLTGAVDLDRGRVLIDGAGWVREEGGEPRVHGDLVLEGLDVVTLPLGGADLDRDCLEWQGEGASGVICPADQK